MFYLQHRYQGDSWKPLFDTNEPFRDLERAKRRAKKQSVSLGMVRVVDARGEPKAYFKHGDDVGPSY